MESTSHKIYTRYKDHGAKALSDRPRTPVRAGPDFDPRRPCHTAFARPIQVRGLFPMCSDWTGRRAKPYQNG